MLGRCDLNSSERSKTMTLEELLRSKITISGCTIEVKDEEVIIHTPDILTDTNLIVLQNDAELRQLQKLLAGRELVTNTNVVGVTAKLIALYIE